MLLCCTNQYVRCPLLAHGPSCSYRDWSHSGQEYPCIIMRLLWLPLQVWRHASLVLVALGLPSPSSLVLQQCAAAVAGLGMCRQHDSKPYLVQLEGGRGTTSHSHRLHIIPSSALCVDIFCVFSLFTSWLNLFFWCCRRSDIRLIMSPLVPLSLPHQHHAGMMGGVQWIKTLTF